ncbi:MAG: L-serine ammonia-lyase [Paracoccaceae bacterium]|nr:L-serine ammonia-lyase [Paracoccaceae bacterium]
MSLSVFDLFKIGVGPSSSHTMGPMIAAARFVDDICEAGLAVTRLHCRLHGSLAFTGIGHGSDRAVALGFAAFTPEAFDAEKAAVVLDRIRNDHKVHSPSHGEFIFDPARDLVFDFENRLEGHANGMTFSGFDSQGQVIAEAVIYSVGGGSILTADELAERSSPSRSTDAAGVVPGVPYPFRSAAELLELARTHDRSIAEMMLANESAIATGGRNDAGLDSEVRTRLLDLWNVMTRCIDAGLSAEGTLPGGLGVRRRAKSIRDSLIADRGRNQTMPHVINDWISAYAMAVNEQNAAGAQVVTAPTNGAAGVVPAVFRYYLDHVSGADDNHAAEYLLTAGAVGGIIKSNASISGAEVGCQGEVGSASAMAAAGLCAVLGGTPAQIENAAEIALEHHLGMTCDPIKGLVQAPCIERNGLGAIKAVSAASLALRSDGTHLVPLDACIETMRQTGLDMNEKYKETSTGGLAVNLPAC